MKQVRRNPFFNAIFQWFWVTAVIFSLFVSCGGSDSSNNGSKTDFSACPNEIEIAVGESTKVALYGGTPDYNFSDESSDSIPQIVTNQEIESNQWLNIQGASPGEGTITILDANGDRVSIDIVVVEPESILDPALTFHAAPDLINLEAQDIIDVTISNDDGQYSITMDENLEGVLTIGGDGYSEDEIGHYTGTENTFTITNTLEDGSPLTEGKVFIEDISTGDNAEISVTANPPSTDQPESNGLNADPNPVYLTAGGEERSISISPIDNNLSINSYQIIEIADLSSLIQINSQEISSLPFDIPNNNFNITPMGEGNGAIVVSGSVTDSNGNPIEYSVDVEVNISSGALSVADSVSLQRGLSDVVTINGGFLPYKIRSISNTSIVSAEISDTTLQITGHIAGTARIEVSDESNPAEPETLNVTVTENDFRVNQQDVPVQVGRTSNLVQVSGGLAPYKFITPECNDSILSDINLNDDDTLTFTATEPGPAVITITDSSQPPAEMDVFVTVTPAKCLELNADNQTVTIKDYDSGNTIVDPFDVLFDSACISENTDGGAIIDGDGNEITICYQNVSTGGDGSIESFDLTIKRKNGSSGEENYSFPEDQCY